MIDLLTLLKKRAIISAIVASFVLFALSAFYITQKDELTFGRRPWKNLVETSSSLIHPSFLNLWFGNEKLEYKNDEGQVLRTENQIELEKNYLFALGRALLITLAIATVGSTLALIIGLLFAFLASKRMRFPAPIATLARLLINFNRGIHTLIFGMFFVGIVGLGPMAGILAIMFHSSGSYGKLIYEAIDSLSMEESLALEWSGANRLTIFTQGLIPKLMPQMISLHLYLWEFNVRDSAILGFVGAGGIGLLIQESLALFQWQRLSTLILALFILVSLFNYCSARLREYLGALQ